MLITKYLTDSINTYISEQNKMLYYIQISQT
jgi:hypothetical protein